MSISWGDVADSALGPRWARHRSRELQTLHPGGSSDATYMRRLARTATQLKCALRLPDQLRTDRPKGISILPRSFPLKLYYLPWEQCPVTIHLEHREMNPAPARGFCRVRDSPSIVEMPFANDGADRRTQHEVGEQEEPVVVKSPYTWRVALPFAPTLKRRTSTYEMWSPSLSGLKVPWKVYEHAWL